MEGLRVYIAGPMESVGGNWNMPLFDYVADRLRTMGCEVFSPAEHIREMHGNLETVLKMDKAMARLARKEALKDEIAWIIDFAQVVAMLDGWEQSSGAVAERAVALAVGIKVRELGTILLPTNPESLDPEPLWVDTE
jgi:Domain of unknown function (DUF4406)